MKPILFAVPWFALVSSAFAEEAPSAASPPTDRRTTLYVSNREPLAPSPLVKLPPGSIQPKGWLRHQLDAMRDGLTGRLTEISPWCQFGGNAWTDPKGQGHSGWEEMPYWLKGFGDLGRVTGDERLLKETKKWIDAVLATQEKDGWFGPVALKTSLNGKPDLWPHMLVLDCLQSWYEATSDERVLPFLTKYFRWQLAQPEKDFLAGYWPKMRGGDNLASVYWLYNRSGDRWLLDLATKVHRATAAWESGVIDWHGVNVTQGFREPTLYWQQSQQKKHRDGAARNYDTVMGTYGQFPGGGFAADENARPGYADPRQGFETCAIVEYMHSFEMLTRITGDPLWADRCEEVALNSLPGARTPDSKALHYLTGANMVQLDRQNKAPGIQNGGTMLSFSPFAVYRCCQHNVAHGWPYYAEELWLATSDGGLCASLYAASEVRAQVADGSRVTITEATDYPFSDTVTLKVGTMSAVKFPLYLRVPRWSGKPVLRINDREVKAEGKSGEYLVLKREWRDGDSVTLRLPMSVAVKTWPKNKDAVSVHYGPLAFALKIGEKWVRYGGKDGWPEQEVYPTTPFNYGLVLKADKPAESFLLKRSDKRLPDNPFTPGTAPITLTAKARRIPQWTQDANGLLNPLQPSPAKSQEPEETVTLIPMGAARLRISAFPVIGDGTDAHVWVKPPPAPRASHCWPADTTAALNDGLLPKSSDDPSIPRFTWWDHKGTTEWVEYDFEKPQKLKAAEVYWFDDEPSKGGCRVPASWRLLVKVGDAWQEVGRPSAYGVQKDKFNRVTFDAITTSAIRLEAQLRAGFSGGILEWRVE
ncbi:MAG TPA: beta-L-arabinofuranosidase domain-containing protein [Gemmataceae bacterium]|nr:beta-L-arabinofuranosidase domain-containing protein [Gemmataceae bacterium]